MRTTDFCFPLLRLRAPALRQLPASLRGLRLALDTRACTHGQETGGPGVSRRPIRFGVPVRVGGLRHVSPSAPERAMPLTPLSRPSLRAALSHERFGSGCQGRASRPSVKIERALRPRVPSIDRGHSRSCANRRRSRVRSRERFRFDPALGVLSPVAPRVPLLALTRSYSGLGPRPRSPLAPRVKGLQRALHGARLPPIDFCNYVYDARTHSRAPCPRVSSEGRQRPVAFEGRPHVRSPCLGGGAPPLSRKHGESREPRQPISKHGLRRCKHAEGSGLENHRRVGPSLAGDAPTRPPLAATAGWTMALDCAGREASSKGPPRSPPAAAGRRGQRFPFSSSGFCAAGAVEASRAPLSVVGPSSEGLDAPFVLFDPTEAPVPTSPREGQRFPASRDAFHR